MTAKKDTVSRIGKAFLALVVSYGVIFIVCLWGNLLADEWFWKVTLTYGAILMVLAGVYLIRREFEDDQKMKDDKYMD